MSLKLTDIQSSFVEVHTFKSTGEIGLFNIESESGIASGTRRITATTGHASLKYVNKLEEKLSKVAGMLKTDGKNVVDVVEKYIAEAKKYRKRI